MMNELAGREDNMSQSRKAKNHIFREPQDKYRQKETGDGIVTLAVFFMCVEILFTIYQSVFPEMGMDFRFYVMSGSVWMLLRFIALLLLVLLPYIVSFQKWAFYSTIVLEVVSIVLVLLGTNGGFPATKQQWALVLFMAAPILLLIARQSAFTYRLHYQFSLGSVLGGGFFVLLQWSNAAYSMFALYRQMGENVSIGRCYLRIIGLIMPNGQYVTEKGLSAVPMIEGHFCQFVSWFMILSIIVTAVLMIYTYFVFEHGESDFLQTIGYVVSMLFFVVVKLLPRKEKVSPDEPLEETEQLSEVAFVLEPPELQADKEVVQKLLVENNVVDEADAETKVETEAEAVEEAEEVEEAAEEVEKEEVAEAVGEIEKEPEAEEVEETVEEVEKEEVAEAVEEIEKESEVEKVEEAAEEVEKKPEAQERVEEIKEQLERTKPKGIASCVADYAYNFASYMALDVGGKVFEGTAVEGYIPYRIIGKEAVISGGPICHPRDMKQLLSEYEEFCFNKKISMTFVNVSREQAQAMEQWNYSKVHCGAEPRFTLKQYKLKNPAAVKNQREKIQQKYGVMISEYRYYEERNPELEMQLSALNDDWLDSRNSEDFTIYKRRQRDAFLPQTLSFDNENKRRYYYAVNEKNEIAGFIVFCPVTSQNGYSCEAGRKRAGQIKNLMELIMHEAFAALKAEGANWASMGLIPDSHEKDALSTRQLRWQNFIYRYYESIYACRDYKEALPKYKPTNWENMYIVTREYQDMKKEKQ